MYFLSFSLDWLIISLLMAVVEKWWCRLVFSVSEHIVQTLSLYCLSLLISAADLLRELDRAGAAGLVVLGAELVPGVLVDMLALRLDLLGAELVPGVLVDLLAL